MKCYNICSTLDIYNYLTNTCEVFNCPDPNMRINRTSNSCYCQYHYIFNATTSKCQENCKLYGKIFNITTQKC